MTNPTPPVNGTAPHPMSRREQVEAWSPVLFRISGFVFGMVLIYREQGPPPGVEEWIIFAAIGCMGPTVASAVATILEAARGTR